MSQIYLTFQILLISLAQDLSFQSGHLGRQLSYFDRFNRPGLDSAVPAQAVRLVRLKPDHFFSELMKFIIASEASFLVCSMRGFSIYLYIYIYIYFRPYVVP